MKITYYIVKSECETEYIWKINALGDTYFYLDTWGKVSFINVGAEMEEIRIPLDIDLMLDLQLRE